MNGPAARTAKVPLSFLPKGNNQSVVVRDNLDDPAAVVVERGTKSSGDALELPMRAGGGFVARFTR